MKSMKEVHKNPTIYRLIMVVAVIVMLINLCACSKSDPEVERRLDCIKFAYTDNRDKANKNLKDLDIDNTMIGENTNKIFRFWMTFDGETESLNLWDNGILIRYGKVDGRYALAIGYFDLIDSELTLHYRYDGKTYEESYECSFQDNSYNPRKPILILKNEDGTKIFNSLPNYSYDEEMERLKGGL